MDTDTLLPYDEARRQFTRTYLCRLLRLTGGNVSRAARLAGRNRTDLYKLMRRTGVSLAEFKRPLADAGQAGP